MRLLIVMLVVLLVASCATEEQAPTPESTALDKQMATVARNCLGRDGTLAGYGMAHLACVKMVAIRLEPTGSAPGDIALAATSECQQTRTQADDFAALCRTYYRSVGLSILPSYEADLDAQASGYVAQVVLEARSARR